MLADVKSSNELFGEMTVNELNLRIPITGVIGDSQAALFGQKCYKKGTAKATFGTGTSILVQTEDLVVGSDGLIEYRDYLDRYQYERGMILLIAKLVIIQFCKANLLKPGDAVRQDIIDRLVKLSGKLGTVMDDTGMFQSSSVPSPVSSPEGKSFKEAS